MARRSAFLALVAVTALVAVPVAVHAQGNPLAQLGALLGKDPRFTTALQLISSSDVASLVAPILNSGNKTTVLLPTVDAFDRVFHDFSKYSPGFNASTFLALKNGSVAKVLSYHLVKGLYRKADLKNGLKLSTYNGANITVSRYRKSVKNRTYEVIHFVDLARRQAAVNKFDINATSNIVIHVLEKVLLPAPVRTFLRSAGLKV